MKTKTVIFIYLILFVFYFSFAIPSFSRQTGLSCHQCHSHHNHPSLTPYGGQFKAEGFTFENTKTS